MSFIAPRIRDRTRRERGRAMTPIAVTYVAGLLLIPETMVWAGLPETVAYDAMTGAFGAGFVGLFLAMATRPSNRSHLVLLSLAVLAMVAAGQMASVGIHYLAAADSPHGAGFGLGAIRAIASVGAGVIIWYLIAFATRGDSLWD